MFKKKNESDILLEKSISTQHSEKKKENRKSIRNRPVLEKKKKEIEKLDESTTQPTGPILEEIIQSFQKELLNQNELLDNMKEESLFLKLKIQEESEKCSNIMEQFESDILAIRKTTEEERKERRKLQHLLDNLQNSLTIPQTPLSQANPITPLTNIKLSTKNQNSKTNKRTQKKKKNIT